MLLLTWLFDAFVYFKRRNFTVTKEFKIGDITVKEYTYNMSRYYTDTWPPNTSAGSGFPIAHVIREGDGADITQSVLKFSGPRKNYINPLSLCTRKKKIHVRFVNFGVRVSLEDVWVSYTGELIVTDILGGRRTIQINSPGFDAASASKIHQNTVRVPSGS